MHAAAQDHHGHEHDHSRVHGPDCTHAHGPALEEVAKLANWRDAAVLVAGIAVRPCSGALFVLILTWQLGIALAGVISAFVIGMGTALVTMKTGLMAVWAREGSFAGLGSGRITRALPLVELAVGALIALAALGLLVQSF